MRNERCAKWGRQQVPSPFVHPPELNFVIWPARLLVRLQSDAETLVNSATFTDIMHFNRVCNSSRLKCVGERSSSRTGDVGDATAGFTQLNAIRNGNEVETEAI